MTFDEAYIELQELSIKYNFDFYSVRYEQTPYRIEISIYVNKQFKKINEENGHWTRPYQNFYPALEEIKELLNQETEGLITKNIDNAEGIKD